MTVEYFITCYDGNITIAPVGVETADLQAAEGCPELSAGELELQHQVLGAITENTIDIRSLYGMIHG